MYVVHNNDMNLFNEIVYPTSICWPTLWTSFNSLRHTHRYAQIFFLFACFTHVHLSFIFIKFNRKMDIVSNELSDSIYIGRIELVCTDFLIKICKLSLWLAIDFCCCWIDLVSGECWECFEFLFFSLLGC